MKRPKQAWQIMEEDSKIAIYEGEKLICVCDKDPDSVTTIITAPHLRAAIESLDTMLREIAKDRCNIFTQDAAENLSQSIELMNVIRRTTDEVYDYLTRL